MPKISGEAAQDHGTQKWCFVISADDGRILFKSGIVFSTALEAEAELIEVIERLGEYVHDVGQGG